MRKLAYDWTEYNVGRRELAMIAGSVKVTAYTSGVRGPDVADASSVCSAMLFPAGELHHFTRPNHDASVHSLSAKFTPDNESLS